ncbi:plasmid mobilization relaxosome protein MobC [Steroidobacter sp. S1-65]|uniref:Plasmid mobilization relaxosome protein MobC n=1 Tax=Steroidobacter gossypii TaxID=2805490 RepID=A0ABS1X5V6_9GAMM|nr:plasmid mobilization relaxosome protein MobC [Steroidobacter gossypii]MBM0108605.1 plasmid mobilization relaxosome protein MobC [Steroidobacter gossypii]
MGTTQFIAARFSPETKARFRNLAERRQMSESALLKVLVDSAVRGVGEVDADVLEPPGRRLRGARTSVRLHPDDKLLLRERAASRQMAVATYISVLVRAHLRNLAPLPKAELMALKQSVAEVSAIGRNLNQLTRLAHQGAGGPTRGDLLAILKVCEALRDHTKDLMKANARSWTRGDENVSP